MAKLGLPKNADGWRKPPFNFQDPHTGQTMVVNDAIDQHRIFNSWVSDQFEFSLFLAHPSTFIDSGIQDVIKRLHYSERFPGTPPFPGSYQDVPTWWKQALIIMDNAFIDAEAFKKKKV